VGGPFGGGAGRGGATQALQEALCLLLRRDEAPGGALAAGSRQQAGAPPARGGHRPDRPPPRPLRRWRGIRQRAAAADEANKLAKYDFPLNNEENSGYRAVLVPRRGLLFNGRPVGLDNFQQTKRRWPAASG
jgi:hypothetical protein